MGGPVSVVFSDIFICKMAEDVVVPVKPIFCKRCWWHIYTEKKCSKIPTDYTQNAITSELHTAKKIAMGYDKELKRTK